MAEVSFEQRFERAARPVRRWLVLRSALVGLGAGLALGAAAAGAAWWLRADVRPVAAAVGALAGVAGSLLYARRARLSRAELALYLDRRLASDEAIATALEYEGVARDAGEAGLPKGARAAVVERALAALDAGDPERLRPRWLSRWHGLVPVGLAAALAVCLVPMRPAPALPPPPPGSEQVSLPTAPQIDRVIESLERMTPRDAEQAQRLADMRKQALAIKEKLAKGAARREVQAELGELSNALARERLSLGEGEHKQGFEDALAKLDTKELEPAKRALADHDLARFDEEMAKLANRYEKESREAAKRALEEASSAAKKGGADDVAKLLDQKKKELEKRGKELDEARKLADALKGQASEEQKKALEGLQSGDPEAQRKALEALKKALDDLDPEQQKKLAEALAKQAKDAAKDGKLSPEDVKRLEELAKKLDTPEGREALKKALEELAKGPPPSGEAKAQQDLKDMQADLEDLKRMLEQGANGSPGPRPAGPSASGPSPAGTGSGGAGGSSSAGPSGKKPNAPTNKVDAKDVRARSSAELNPGAPMSGNKTTRTAARPGETANKAGTGALGAAGADEVGGVTRSDVPEEYREQVGRYFQP